MCPSSRAWVGYLSLSQPRSQGFCRPRPPHKEKPWNEVGPSLSRTSFYRSVCGQRRWGVSVVLLSFSLLSGDFKDPRNRFFVSISYKPFPGMRLWKWWTTLWTIDESFTGPPSHPHPYFPSPWKLLLCTANSRKAIITVTTTTATTAKLTIVIIWLTFVQTLFARGQRKLKTHPVKHQTSTGFEPKTFSIPVY